MGEVKALQADSLADCTSQLAKQTKNSVFLHAGMSGDKNQYGYIYQVLVRCHPSLRLLFLAYQLHLNTLYVALLL